MSEARKFDWTVIKPISIGLGSAGLALSVAVLFNMNNRNSDLQRDLSEVRVQLGQAQQTIALLQRFPPTAPVMAQAAPAPQTQPAAVATEPAPVRASAASITFDMLVPGEEARPPIPVKAPMDAVPRSAKRERTAPKRDEARGKAPTADEPAQGEEEKPRRGFVLLDKSAPDQPRQSNFKLIGQ